MRATNFCARQEWRNCMITLLTCGSMLTSRAFGREHISLAFGSLVLNGLDFPSGCFDLLIPNTLAITRLSAPVLACGDYFRIADHSPRTSSFVSHKPRLGMNGARGTAEANFKMLPGSWQRSRKENSRGRLTNISCLPPYKLDDAPITYRSFVVI
jgi:hypothetical protein